jgi:membrane fusion protein (multidrug efflux system)
MSDLSRAISPHLLSLALLMGLAACEKPVQQPAAAPPIEVTAVTLAPQDVPVNYEFVGRTESSRKVEIRARVDGFLDKRVYQEGSLVKEGQVLFLIDRKPFEARLAAVKAELAEQQARLITAQANLTRIKPLVEQNAVSKKDLDDATGQAQAAAAAVAGAKADVINIELNLGYTTIRTPVTGLASYAAVQDGTYVNAANSLLTSVSAVSPMRVNFSISENQLLGTREEIAAGRLRFPQQEKLDVEIVLADGKTYPEEGRITFADAEYSESTGTYLIRAEFPNKQATLKPGQFVQVKVHGALRPNTILIPKRAVQQGGQGSFVWVVGKDGKAELRPVILGDWYGDDWIVKQGLQPGETVAVDGAIKLRTAAPVKATALATSDAKATTPVGPKDASEAKPTPSGRTEASDGEPAAPAEPKEAGTVKPTTPAEPKKASTAMSRGAPSAAAAGAGASLLPARVYFASDKAALTDDAKTSIARIADALQKTAAKVYVTGYTDNTGTLERNRELGKDRAMAVRDALIAEGVTKDRINLKAPAEVIGTGSDDEARRVEVVLGEGAK